MYFDEQGDICLKTIAGCRETNTINSASLEKLISKKQPNVKTIFLYDSQGKTPNTHIR